MTTAPLPKRVFITGAQGFIGQQLMRRYRDLGCDVRGMDLQGNPEQGIVAADLCQPKQWAHHVEGCELFIHTAAVVSLSASWADYRRITVDGVRHALANAQRAGCRRFVHFSSILAMGYDYVDGADEQAPVVIGKDCRYGVAKGASEHLVLAAHASGNIDCCIIRPGDVYGPGSRAWLLEPLKMARSGRLLLPNGGRGIFTPIYIDDLIDGTLLAAHSEAASGQIFILWGEQAVSCGEFFSYHWRWAGRRVARRRRQWLPGARRVVFPGRALRCAGRASSAASGPAPVAALRRKLLHGRHLRGRRGRRALRRGGARRRGRGRLRGAPPRPQSWPWRRSGGGRRGGC